jgi:hypothetical protein
MVMLKNVEIGSISTPERLLTNPASTEQKGFGSDRIWIRIHKTFPTRSNFLYIQDVLLNIVRSGSNLLDARNLEAWSDLEAGQQVRLASALLAALHENAALFAAVTHQPEKLVESSNNICKFY